MRLYSMQTLKTATAFRRRCWIFGDLWPPMMRSALPPRNIRGPYPASAKHVLLGLRLSPTDDFGSVFQDKPVALMASSPGRLGGVRAIPRLRDCVCELGMLPVPGFVMSAMRRRPFPDNGHLRDDGPAQSLHALVRRLVACAG